MKKPRIVIALGGNALQRDGELTAEAQKAVASRIGKTIAQLSRSHEIVVAHGNGPQVGNILIHEESASTTSAPAMPLETAVAMSQGQIGYWLAQAIDNAFLESGQSRTVASLITQVVVDRRDPAFRRPTKPIGEFYDEKTAAELSRTRGWTMREDSGRGYRRVVPSPKPIDIVERRQIRDLVNSGAIVIAAGGGGIPVTRTKVRRLIKGVDAVIDKDLAAAKLARLVRADIFVSVTAVSHAFINFGQPDQTPLGQVSKAELRAHIAAGQFAAGSMLPKVEAIMEFANKNRTGIITSPENLTAALAGKSGTIVRA